jgi:hypothetical protein
LPNIEITAKQEGIAGVYDKWNYLSVMIEKELQNKENPDS